MTNNKIAKPVVFLAFANDPENYLGQLRNEAEQLRELLEQAGDVCELVMRENASLDNILDVFQDPKHKHRIAIFHFGGHANSYKLLLESAEGQAMPADAAGLATFLAQQQGLQLVFLNGCATQKQAQGLLDAGVKAVIATDRKIKDNVAANFAARFYQGLTGGDDLPAAFAAAQGAIQFAIGDEAQRAYLDEEDFGDTPPDTWPWELYPPELPEEMAAWNLSRLADNPYWLMPPLPPRPLPPQPFLGLSYFRQKHAEIFFGRGWQILALYKLITDEILSSNPIILLYGQSGVGKSSLLAAGLLPRLKQVAEVRYVRREEAGNDLTAALGRALGDGPPNPPEGEPPDFTPPSGEPGGDLTDLWRAQETGDRPLVIILDQIEEIYTRPGDDPAREMADFLKALQTIFGDEVDRWPKGKLILGFRKEWLAEIRDRLAERELPYKEMFLKHLDRPGIIEAITGPATAPRLKAQYELKIADEEPGEAQVPEVIADDLLADRGSAIAPTLQIILTKLWENATGKPKVFSRKLYDDLRLRPANFLGQLLDQQLGELAEIHPKESKSGLVLDLLAYHTTEVGTTQQRSRTELAEAYRHQADILPSLVQSCKDRYLLVTPAGDVDEEAPDATRLSHDTLGPLVRARFDVSQRPGQRAYRLLQNRISDWQSGKTGPILQEEDLTLVEKGLDGMRVRISEKGKDEEASPEERLIQASRKAQDARETQRRIRWGVAIAAAILIVLGGVTSFILWRQSQAALAAEEAANARILARSLVNRGEQLYTETPLLGLWLVLEAWPQVGGDSNDPLNCGQASDQDTQLRCDIIRSIREKVSQGRVLTIGNQVENLYFDDRFSFLLVDYLTEPGVLLELSNRTVLTTSLPAPIGNVFFNLNRTDFIVAYTDQEGMLYQNSTIESLITTSLDGWVGWVEYSPDRQSFTVDYNGKAGQLYQITSTGLISRLLNGEVHKVYYSPDGTRFVVNYATYPDELVRFGSDDLDFLPLNGKVDWVQYSPDGQSMVVSYDAQVDQLVWLGSDDLDSLPLNGEADWVQYSPDGQSFMVDYSGKVGKLHQITPDGLHSTPLKGEIDSILAAPDDLSFVVDYRSDTGEFYQFTPAGLTSTLLSGQVGRAFYSSNGQSFVVDYVDGVGQFHQITPTGLRSTQLEDQLQYTKHDHDSSSFAVGYENSPGQLYDITPTGPVLKTVFRTNVERMEFSPNGDYLLIKYEAPNQYELWSLGEQPRHLVELGPDLKELSNGQHLYFSVNSEAIAVYGDGRAYLLNLAWLEMMSTMEQDSIEDLSPEELFDIACQPFHSNFFTAEDETRLIEELQSLGIEEPQACK